MVTMNTSQRERDVDHPGHARASDIRNTRQAILDAALDQFATVGFAATSMRGLAGAVGVRESTLYYHFPSKEAILKDFVSESVGSRLELLAGIDYDEALRGSVRELLGRLAHQCLAGLSSPRERKIVRIKILEAHRLKGPGLRALLQSLLNGLADLFTELIRRKKIRALDPRLLAQEFMGPLQAVAILSILLDEPYKPETRKAIDEHLDFFVEAVTP
jgi:TetR/AcrR family transcriptional regulator, biofilm operon repressor